MNKYGYPVVYLEAGHSDADPGAVSSNSGKNVCERDEVRIVTDKAAKILKEDYKIEVHTDPETARWFQPVDAANALGDCDLYISIHANAAGSKEARGSEFYIYGHNSERDRLGRCFEKQFEMLGQYWRGTKEEPEFVVLRDTNMMAGLIELYFVTSKEAAKWATPEGRTKLAKAVAAAVAEYVKAEPRRKSSGGGKPPRKPKPVTVEMTDVRLGDTHRVARAALRELKARGWYDGTTKVVTKEAVEDIKRFQAEMGLTVDGWMGAKTLHALYCLPVPHK